MSKLRIAYKNNDLSDLTGFDESDLALGIYNETLNKYFPVEEVFDYKLNLIIEDNDVVVNSYISVFKKDYDGFHKEVLKHIIINTANLESWNPAKISIKTNSSTNNLFDKLNTLEDNYYDSRQQFNREYGIAHLFANDFVYLTRNEENIYVWPTQKFAKHCVHISKKEPWKNSSLKIT